MRGLQYNWGLRALAILLAASCSTFAGHTSAQRRLIVITGRIVDAGGRPVAGARVDLMSFDTPHRAPYAMVTTTTRASGVFELPRRQFDRLVVTAGSATYAYRPSDSGGVLANGRTEIQLGDLPIGALRYLPITAECATAPPPDPSWMGVWISIEWRGHGLLHPRLMSEGLGFLDSGDSGTLHRLMPRSPGDRVFERRIGVPPGTHVITVRGGCGDATARVIVPVEGDVTPVHVALADPR